jgi:cell fate regulator YaaT (PSP1 superfamily)
MTENKGNGPKKDIAFLPRSYGSGLTDPTVPGEDQEILREEPSSCPDDEAHASEDSIAESSLSKGPEEEDDTESTVRCRVICDAPRPAQKVSRSETVPESIHDSGRPADESEETWTEDEEELPCCDSHAEIASPEPARSAPDRTREDQAASDVNGADEELAEERRRLKVKVNLVGVRFDYAAKIYHFDAEDLQLKAGEWVVVRTEKGLGLGRIVVPPVEWDLEPHQLDGLRKITRKAGRADLDQKRRCAEREREAFVYCQGRIEDLSLPMKLVSVECFFDASKYIFYFTADGRVDFRELVKQLVARFPARIEMRQIGVRHEAKMTGGLACCGQELCCSRFLSEFRPVSVKMAKTQNLSLNPSKISGVCGRLMCCLGYEHDTYECFKKGLPKVGRTVTTPRGPAVIVKHNPLTQSAQVKLEDETLIDVSKEEIISEIAPQHKKADKRSEPKRGAQKPGRRKNNREPKSKRGGNQHQNRGTDHESS